MCVCVCECVSASVCECVSASVRACVCACVLPRILLPTSPNYTVHSRRRAVLQLATRGTTKSPCFLEVRRNTAPSCLSVQLALQLFAFVCALQPSASAVLSMLSLSHVCVCLCLCVSVCEGIMQIGWATEDCTYQTEEGQGITQGLRTDVSWLTHRDRDRDGRTDERER